ncbi:MAG: hypothetical protein HKN27_02615 [Silicimonas sp.]|nr:hypothetical protein [Silicimonas sp.]
MGAVIFSLPAALIGAVYYTMTFGLGLLEAFSLYVALGFMVMAGITLFNCVVLHLYQAYSNPATRAR